MSAIQRTQQGPEMSGPSHDNATAGPAAAGPAAAGPAPGVRASALALMWFATATLAVVSPLHLAGLIGNGPDLNPGAAGTGEAVIAVVLAAAATAAWRMPRHARPLTAGALCFAILGFGFGLSITARGGDAFDVTYHAVMLPVLIGTLILLLRPRRETGTAGR